MDNNSFDPNDFELTPEGLTPELSANEPMNVPEGFRAGFAALIGPPNAGKSTLLNAYLGSKIAIVTSKPQTTRNRISGILTRELAQVVFLDTPGVHDKRGEMNRLLVRAAWQALSEADCVVLVADAAFALGKPEAFEEEFSRIRDNLSGGERTLPLMIALNKVDKFADKSRLLPLMERMAKTFPETELFPVSALTGEGLEKLLTAVVKHLPEGPPIFPEDQLSTAPVRFLAAELIREKLMIRLKQELPYSVAVEIESWEEEESRSKTDPRPLTTIHAIIYVARKNHKAMVIGKGGKLLKEIGTESRRELEQLLESKVHLELWVKVREDWTEDPNFLRQIGLTE